MGNRIMELTNEKIKEVEASQDINCPGCGGHQYAIFDKLYTFTYGKCPTCSIDDPEYIRQAENIFMLM